jgi:prolyl 4-hydroxylase
MAAAPVISAQDIAILDTCGGDWRDWLITNMSAGTAIEVLRAQMVEAGWTPALAQEAIAIARRILGLDDAARCRPYLPPIGNIDLDGHPIRVSFQSLLPAIAVCENVLTPSECAALIDLGHAEGLSRSDVVDDEGSDSMVHPERTSTGMAFARRGGDLIQRIEDRLARLTQWPVENGERLQMLRYQPGEEYRPHYDAFYDTVGGRKNKELGGQRVGTVLVYLKAPDKGGGTAFPLAGLTFFPRPGTAILFHNVDAKNECLAHSLHGGMPVEAGEKYILTYWQRESAF